MSYWIDSHCHLTDDMYKDNFDEYMQVAKENNVLVSNIICLNKKDYLAALQYQKLYPNLDISFGFYPEDALSVTDSDLEYLEEVAGNLIGIGEIGLDYHNGKDFADKQKELFIKQIELANKLNLPIEVHSRDAAKDTFDILKQYAKTKVLLHCFSESLEMMKEYLKLGYYVSFAGTVTFKNAISVKNNAQEVPLEKMLIETDCPYLTPVPFRGKPNQTAFVRYTGEYIAQLKGLSIEEVQKQIISNYKELFGK